MSEVSTPSPLRILVVCTANVCRSPVAERLLRQHLDAAGTPAVVTSAGTRGGRLRVHDDTVRAARELIDLDLTSHDSRLLTREIVEHDGADLVIAMTREHLRDGVAMSVDAWPRSFTLKELVRRGLDAPAPADGLDDWRRSIAHGRQTSNLLRPDPIDDVADPYGGPYAGHLRMITEIDALTRVAARLIPAPAGAPTELPGDPEMI